MPTLRRHFLLLSGHRAPAGEPTLPALCLAAPRWRAGPEADL